MQLSQDKQDELRRRREAAPHLPWDGVESYIDFAATLVRPGGVLSVVLPDGQPFTATRPRPEPSDAH